MLHTFSAGIKRRSWPWACSFHYDSTAQVHYSISCSLCYIATNIAIDFSGIHSYWLTVQKSCILTIKPHTAHGTEGRSDSATPEGTSAQKMMMWSTTHHVAKERLPHAGFKETELFRGTHERRIGNPVWNTNAIAMNEVMVVALLLVLTISVYALLSPPAGRMALQRHTISTVMIKKRRHPLLFIDILPMWTRVKRFDWGLKTISSYLLSMRLVQSDCTEVDKADFKAANRIFLQIFFQYSKLTKYHQQNLNSNMNRAYSCKLAILGKNLQSWDRPCPF